MHARRTLVEALDEALKPYMTGDERRRFVCEKVAPVVSDEFMTRLDDALEQIAGPTYVRRWWA